MRALNCVARILRAPSMLAVAVIASALSGSAQQYTFEAYRQPQGLDNLSVMSLAADAEGDLWAGTQNGLFRFVGSRFQRVGLDEGIVEHEIERVLGAPDGTLWVATYRNLYRWDGLRLSPAAATPIEIDTPQSIAFESPGHLLLIVGGRLQRLSYAADGALSSYAPAIPAASIAADRDLVRLRAVTIAPDNTVWLGCGRKICSWVPAWVPGARGRDAVAWGGERNLPEDNYRTLRVGPRGELWAVGDHHVVCLPSGAASFLDRSLPDSETSGLFVNLPLAIDSAGRALVAVHGGIDRWEGTGWKTIGKSNGLKTSHVTSMFFDSNGDLWMGSAGSGLFHWAGYGNWEGWSETQGLPSSNIWAIGPFEGGKVYAGTQLGPAVIDPGSGIVVSDARAAAGWPYGQVKALGHDRRGTLWAATSSGTLLRLQPATMRAAIGKMLGAYAFKMVKDPAGNSFLLTDRGIGLLDDVVASRATQPPMIPEAQRILGGPVRVLDGCVSPDGGTWFVARNRVYRVYAGKWSSPPVAGLPSHSDIRSIACALDGSIFLGGFDSGIFRLAAEGDHLRAAALDMPPPLRLLSVLALLVDPRGWLWVGTDDGVLVWNGTSWRQFTQESGLVWNDVNSVQLALAPDGSIWIGTSAGLGRMTHPERAFDSAPLQLAMIAIRSGKRTLPMDRELDIPWSIQDLSFQFAALNSVNRPSLVFRYRLHELDTAWIETQDETVHFSRLEPGRYTFEVIAQDSASGGPSASRTVRFRIRPPWWRTYWFYALVLVVGALLLAALYRWRVRQLVAQRRHLDRLVRERTVELEASREELRIQATMDGLTRLPNRNAVLALLERELLRARRQGGTVTLVLADLDHFKSINDTYGHAAGDQALVVFAAALAGAIRGYDHAGRYGGEEFLVVLTGIAAELIPDRLAKLHRAITNLPVQHGDSHLVITSSLGAFFMEPGRYVDREKGLAGADAALYAAKRAGRNCFVIQNLPEAASTGTLN